MSFGAPASGVACLIFCLYNAISSDEVTCLVGLPGSSPSLSYPAYSMGPYPWGSHNRYPDPFTLISPTPTRYTTTSLCTFSKKTQRIDLKGTAVWARLLVWGMTFPGLLPGKLDTQVKEWKLLPWQSDTAQRWWSWMVLWGWNRSGKYCCATGLAH